MGLTIPVRFADGVGNVPAAANWNDDYDWLTALAFGLGFLANGGQEKWSSGTTFTNPSNGTILSDNWTEVKSGTTPCTADVTREASVIDTGLYSMKVNVTGAGSSDSYWAIAQSLPNPSGFGSLTVIAGTRIKVATASKVRVKIYDGTTTVYSSYHTGDGTWQLLQAKLATVASPSQLTMTIEINPANFTDAVYIDSAYVYIVPSAISARAQASLVYSPIADVVASEFLPTSGGTLTGNLIFSPTNHGIKGTTTNDNADTGNVGQYVDATVGNTSFSSTGTNFNFASISLTAGDWDVGCVVQLQKNGATVTDWEISISTTSATHGTLGDISLRQVNPGSTESTLAVPLVRISVASTTTIYLVASADYTVATPKIIGGNLRARRVR